MAHTKITMNALAVPFARECCAGCGRKFNRGERMNAMVYEDKSSAGWHCDECKNIWITQGEDKLPRWNRDEPFPMTAES